MPVTDLPFHPVADVVAGGVVVSAVYFSYPRSVEVDRDRRTLARVSDPVDATVARQHGRGPVLRAPPRAARPSSGGRTPFGSRRRGGRSALRAPFRRRRRRRPRRSGRGSRSPSLRARRRPAGSMRRRGRRSGLPRTSLLATSASSSRGRICEPKKAGCFTRSARKRAARGRADPVGSSQMRLSSFVPLARDVVIAGSPFVAGDVSGTTTGSRRCGRLPHSPFLRRERLARAVLLVAGDHFGVAADVGIFGDLRPAGARCVDAGMDGGTAGARCRVRLR